MLKNIWTVVCKSSAIDKDNNNLSLSEILEKFSVDIKVTKETDKPILLPFDFQIVSFWVNKDGLENKAILRFEIVDPNNKSLLKTERELDFKKGIKRIRARILFNKFAVTGSGDYLFNIYLKDQGEKQFIKTSSTPIEVEVKKTIASEAKLHIT